MAAIEAREMVMLYGPRQSGKTTLVQDVQRRVEATGVPVLFITLQLGCKRLLTA
jgi:predicted AAA+ superfamily ATPase